jgi:biopolymer transport protein ExbD
VSHGSSDDGVLEPNLTPLLDLVLQILMFFMVTVNFATEQTNETVMLPFSGSARPLDRKGEKDPIFVNMVVNPDTGEHKVLITGKKDMDLKEARRWILGQYEDLKRFGEVTNPVVIRAHALSEYAKVFELLQSCSDAGFRNLRVRAIVN